MLNSKDDSIGQPWLRARSCIAVQIGQLGQDTNETLC